MGGSRICVSATDKTAKDGFYRLVEKARQEYGHNTYSGTICTCELGGCVKTYDKADRTSISAAMKIADEHLKNIDKGIIAYINCGIENLELVTAVKKKDSYKKPIYKEKYCIYQIGNVWLDSKDTLAEANESALKYTLEKGTHIFLRKEKVLCEGSTTVAEYSIERKLVKTIPKTLKPNQKLVKYYHYLYFGCGQC